MFYSWYRVKPVEAAFREAFDQVFVQVSERIISDEKTLHAFAAQNPATSIHSDQPEDRLADAPSRVDTSRASDEPSEGGVAPVKRNIAVVELEAKNVTAVEASIGVSTLHV